MIEKVFVYNSKYYKPTLPKIEYDPNLYTPMQIALGIPERALKKSEK